MKTLLCILLLATAATQSLLAQTTTLILTTNDTQNIPVLAGEVFELLTWNGDSASMTIDGVPLVSVPTLRPLVPGSVVIAGPRTISVTNSANQGGKLICTYKVTAVSTVATVNVASQAVVIPADATAPVDIILESSTDLTNWTAAVAGSYAPSTSKRFFRVRLVAH